MYNYGREQGDIQQRAEQPPPPQTEPLIWYKVRGCWEKSTQISKMPLKWTWKFHWWSGKHQLNKSDIPIWRLTCSKNSTFTISIFHVNADSDSKLWMLQVNHGVVHQVSLPPFFYGDEEKSVRPPHHWARKLPSHEAFVILLDGIQRRHLWGD